MTKVGRKGASLKFLISPRSSTGEEKLPSRSFCVIHTHSTKVKHCMHGGGRSQRERTLRSRLAGGTGGKWNIYCSKSSTVHHTAYRRPTAAVVVIIRNIHIRYACLPMGRNGDGDFCRWWCGELFFSSFVANFANAETLHSRRGWICVCARLFLHS